MRRKINIWADIDKVTIMLFFILVIIGWFNIYSAVYNEENKGIFDFSQRYGKQFIWIIASFLIAGFIVIIDTRFYIFFARFIYGGIIFLLITVLIFGKEIHGAKSWFEFGQVSLQPAEFAKFGTALILADFLKRRRQELTRMKIILPAVGIILLPALLIAMQPDLGTTVIFLSFFLVLY